MNTILNPLLEKIRKIYNFDSNIYFSKGLKSDYQFNQINMLANVSNLDPTILKNEIIIILNESHMIENLNVVVVNRQTIITFDIDCEYLYNDVVMNKKIIINNPCFIHR